MNNIALNREQLMIRRPGNPRRSYLSDVTEIPPMTLESGFVRSRPLARVTCGHMAQVNVDQRPGTFPVPDVVRKLRCPKRGGRQIKTIPNLTERSAPGVRFGPFGR